MFDFDIAGEPGTVEDVFPGFTEHDRLGVVVRNDFGAVGASTLILAAVTAFYDDQRAKNPEFFVYPDYFLFHTGRARGEHAMLEIFRGHKEVVVFDDPEAILQAINDRAITRLLVEDGIPAAEDLLQPDTRASAEKRIRTYLAYRPSGRVENADVTVTGNEITEGYVGAVLDPVAHAEAMRRRDPVVAERILLRSREVDPEEAAARRAERSGLLRDGRPVETFRRLTPAEGLARLA